MKVLIRKNKIKIIIMDLDIDLKKNHVIIIIIIIIIIIVITKQLVKYNMQHYNIAIMHILQLYRILKLK